MLEKHVRPATPIEPEELTILQEVFDKICERRGIRKNTEAAERAAADLIDLYQHGIRNERQLLVMLSGDKFP